MLFSLRFAALAFLQSSSLYGGCCHAMSLEKTKSLVQPEPRADVEALFERRVIRNRATGSKSWGVEPSENLLSNVMSCSIAARKVMKALYEPPEIDWQQRNAGDWMWDAVYYMIGRLETPKVTEIFDFRGSAPGRLSSTDMEGGAGVIAYNFYERDGSKGTKGTKSFDLASRDLPESEYILESQSIWPLLLKLGKGRFQDGDAPKFYPNRPLNSEKIGPDGLALPFEACRPDPTSTREGLKWPSLCDLTGMISRFTNLTMKVTDRISVRDTSTGLDQVDAIFRNAKSSAVFIALYDGGGSFPEVFVVENAISTQQFAYIPFRQTDYTDSGIPIPVENESSLDRILQRKDAYIVYAE